MRSNSGNEELFSYIKNDEIEKLQNLILKEANFDFTSEYLLIWAAHYGSIKCFKYLVLNNSPLSKNICKDAIAGGNTEIIHYIEQNKEDRDFGSLKCLDYSIFFHRYSITDWLILNYKAKITSFRSSIESFNFFAFLLCQQSTPLTEDDMFTSIRCDNSFMFEYIVSTNKFKFNHKTESEGNSWACYGCPEILGSLNILHFACKEEKAEIVQMICDKKLVNINSIAQGGLTPLHIACIMSSLDIVKILCEHGALVNVSATKYNDLTTPLHIACLNGDLEIVKYLCENTKANKELEDTKRRTPIECARSNGNEEVMVYLYTKQHVRVKDKELLKEIQELCKIITI